MPEDMSRACVCPETYAPTPARSQALHIDKFPTRQATFITVEDMVGPTQEGWGSEFYNRSPSVREWPQVSGRQSKLQMLTAQGSGRRSIAAPNPSLSFVTAWARAFDLRQPGLSNSGSASKTLGRGSKGSHAACPNSKGTERNLDYDTSAHASLHCCTSLAAMFNSVPSPPIPTPCLLSLPPLLSRPFWLLANFGRPILDMWMFSWTVAAMISPWH